ncbi:arginase family protein [Dactylosporangium siamense]|uniref:Arginase n=1 Tax=Dactylosporangium siamense TaxID=685454 RepID=A0A919PH71_9ACTN|nr:arginase family protein [Dactylosporangium siamense]GIG43874.1 arginase [Dactylosporangium siamense]
MRRPGFAVIAAPSALGLQVDGVAGLPDALLEAGLGDLLGARFAGRVEAPPRQDGVDPVTGVRNAGGVAGYAHRLAGTVAEVLDRGEFPVVLGGDCSILLGSLLALRRRGRHGLLFLDGHADFYQPDTDSEAEAASMELAFATGRGPALLADLDGTGPLLRDEDVAAFGMRDAEEQAAAGCAPLPDTLRSWDLDRIRRVGVARAAAEAVAHVARPELDGCWIHVDADVVDDAVMPAVDYRLAGGLSWAELHTVLATAMAGGRVVGFEVTIYNPDLDPGRTAGRALATTIGGALTRA